MKEFKWDLVLGDLVSACQHFIWRTYHKIPVYTFFKSHVNQQEVTTLCQAAVTYTLLLHSPSRLMCWKICWPMTLHIPCLEEGWGFNPQKPCDGFNECCRQTRICERHPAACFQECYGFKFLSSSHPEQCQTLAWGGWGGLVLYKL